MRDADAIDQMSWTHEAMCLVLVRSTGPFLLKTAGSFSELEPWPFDVLIQQALGSPSGPQAGGISFYLQLADTRYAPIK